MRGMAFDPEIDRIHARLAPDVRRALRSDALRINIVGTSGWIGRTTVALIHEALGPERFAQSVACFGSRAGLVEIENGLSVHQRPLSDLAAQDCRPTLMFDLAFITMDKIGQMDSAAYVSANEAISDTVLAALDSIGVDRLFVASSGAAAYADDIEARAELRLYGGLKRADERRFSKWALAAPQRRRTVIARIFSVSGPWINKHEVYALANFILAALSGRPVKVRAPMRVWRSYVAVRELVSLVLAALLAEDEAPVVCFDTGGEALELGAVAARVVEAIGGELSRCPITNLNDNRYVGNTDAYARLLDRYGITHLSLAGQIVETAAYLARQVAIERASR